MNNFLKKYFWCLGVIFIVGGLTSIFLSPSQAIVPIILLSFGIIVIVGWLIYLSNAFNFWQKRSTQTGTNALVSTLSVIVIIGLLNFISFRYYFSLDLTENQVFTLSPQTQEIVKNLEQPLKVWLFEDQTNLIDTSLLKEYAKYNKNFQFEIVDPNVKIALAQKFQVKNLGDTFIEYQDKIQQITTLNPQAQLTEIILTNSISKILTDQELLVYFIQGHGQPSLTPSQGAMSQAVSGLEAIGYQVKPLILASNNQVPDDCDILVLAGAKRKLLDKEVKLIEDYLNRGGSLFLLLEPEVKTGLEPIFKAWGIELNLNYIIIDPSTNNPATSVVTFYGDHPITEQFNNGISIYDFATPIGTISVEGVEAIALVTTNEETWAENIDNLTDNTEIKFDEGLDLAGPLDLAVALTRLPPENQTSNNNSQNNPEEKANSSNENQEENAETNPNSSNENQEETTETNPNSSNENQEENTENNPNSSNENQEENTETKATETKIESRMVIIGDTSFAVDGLFENQLNGDLFLNSVKWLGKDEDNPLSIRPKEFQNRRLNISPLQSLIMTLLALVLFPLLGVILAIFTWWKRQ